MKRGMVGIKCPVCGKIMEVHVLTVGTMCDSCGILFEIYIPEGCLYVFSEEGEV